MSFVVKTLGMGIGLASEAIHHSREKKNAASSTSPTSPSSTSRGLVTSQVVQPYSPPHPYLAQPHYSAPPPYQTTPYAGEGSQYDHSDIYDHYASDEAAWELDSMAQRVDHRYNQQQAVAPSVPAPQPGDSEEVKAAKEKDMIRELVGLAGPPPIPPRRLERPVILPQRRPGSSDRGFVRAYAPCLGDFGLSQDVFLRFLVDWQLASKASPWINVVMVATTVGSFVPELGVQIASSVLTVVAGAAQQVQSRQRRSSYLDRANQELFMPRGLFAVVMKFEGGGDSIQTPGLIGAGQALFRSEQVDVRSPGSTMDQVQAAAVAAIERQHGATESSLATFKRNMAGSAGKTCSELELPPAAELVYPDLDDAADRDLAAVLDGRSEQETAGIKSKWHSAGAFVADYLDRRAQAEYERDHPGSALAVSSANRQPFASRFSDVNHPANSGSLIALLTGGAIAPERRWDRRDRDRGRHDEDDWEDRRDRGGRRERRGLIGGLAEGRDRRGRGRGERRGLIGGLVAAGLNSRREPQNSQQQYPPQQPQPQPRRRQSRKAKKDVLYLMIANLPTSEEVHSSEANLNNWVQ